MSTAAANPSEIAAGTLLAGKYRVERMIGQGGMGVVVEARHVTLEDRVALKFLLPEYASHPEASQRFLREARAAVRIKSPHVARVSDVGTLDSGAPYMVMEFLQGEDASHAMTHGQLLPISEAVDYIVQASDALSDAHALGIIHRDIKPANLFVTRHSDGSPFIKLLDFGISKIVGEGGGVDGLTRTSATMGSALYMSPEQIKQSRSVDHRTDIYALGVSLYELLTGRQPFLAESFAALCVEIATGTPTPIREIRPDIPPEFAAILEKAYARDLSARYQSVAELAVALAPWAPPRSQPIIERIARAAGLVPRFSASPGPDAAGRGSYAHLGLAGSGSNPAFGTGSAPALAAGPNAPAGAATNLDGSTTVPPKAASAAKPLLIAGAVLGLVAVGAVAVVVALKRPGAAAAAESASAPPTDLAAQAPPVDLPKVEPAVAEPPPAPPASASAEPPSPPSKIATSTKTVSKAATKAEPAKPEPAKPEPAKVEPTKPPEPAPPPPKPKPPIKKADDYR